MKTFRSLRHRNYRLYFVGQMVSLIGSWMQMTALIWFAFSLTGESKWPAFITAAQIGPTFLLGPVGGWLADHFPKRPLILGTQTAYLLIASLLTILVFAGAITPPLLLVVMFANGLIQAIDLPARLSFVPNLVPREDLINSVALNSLLFNVARLVGPALAGVLLVASGPAVCVLLNAISYVAVLWALLRMEYPPEPPRAEGRRSSPWSGFAILASAPRLGMLVALAGTLSLCGWPLLTLLPAYASRVLGAGEATYSLLLSSIGAGALCGALGVARFGDPERQWGFLTGGCVAVCLGLTGLAAASSVSPAVFSCALFGCGMICVFATGQSAVQLGTTDATRGRVMGIWAMVLSGGVPIGNLILGPVADRFGEVRVLTGQAIVVGVLIVLGLATRMSRRGLTAPREAVQ